MDANITPGAPQYAENGRITFLEAPQPEPANFFAPGGLQERSGADLYSPHVASWQPPGAQGVAGCLRELIFIIFGAVVAPFWYFFLFIIFGTVLGFALPFEDYYPSPKSPLRPSKGHYVGGLPPRFHGSAGARVSAYN